MREYIKGKFPNPIIVPGCAKCGTSIVAVLLRAMGVFMGERFHHEIRSFAEPDYPYGTYEDWDFHLINRAKFPSEEERRGAFRYFIRHRESLGFKWGFKESKFVRFLDTYMEVLKKPLFIYCTRPIRECGQRSNRWFENRTAADECFIGRKDTLVIEFDDMVYGDTLKEIQRILDFVSILADPEEFLSYVKRRSR